MFLPLAKYWTKNTDSMRKFLLSFILLIVSISAWALTPYNIWKDQIIREGQRQLLRLQKENASNDAKGRSNENSYLVIVSPGYPNAEYITQRKGVGRGADAQYLLDQTTLANLDGTLRAMNSTSDIDTYVLIVHFMPMEFVNEIPDDQTIRDFFAGTKREIVSAIAQPISDEAASIVTGITSEPLGKVTKPTLYCGFVNFRAFKSDKEGISQWVYYPNNSQINFDEQYKNLLNRVIRNTSFPQDEVAKVVTLIDAIQKNNAEYKRLKGSLEAILKITDPDQMAELVHNAGNIGIAAFDLTQRVHALKVLSSARLNEGRETQVLNLLTTAPTRDYEPLLDSLMTSNKFSSEREALLKCIVGRTDDEHLLWGDDNYLQLVKTIAHLVKNSSGIDAKTGAYIGDPENNRTLVWDKSYALNFFINAPIGTNAYDVDLMDNGYIHVKYKYVTDWKCETRTQAKSEISYETCQEIWSDEDEFVVNPFDLIGFINRSDLAILDGVGDKDAKVIVVPALMLQYAQDKKFNANAAAGFFMTLDAVTILVPMTKVYNLAKITQRIYLGLDLAAAAGSIGNLTVNMLNNDPAFAGVVAKYNLVTGVINIAALAGGTKLAVNLAGEFVGEVNKPGVKEALQQLAVKGNKNADEILALERELQLEGKVAGQNWVTSIAQNTAANIDITDDAITLGADLSRAKSYLAKTAPPAGTIDVVVHGSGDEYILLVNGVEKTFDHRALATWLSKNGYDKNTIRLLSCSSLESAQDLANKLNQKVIAVEDAVRVFEDGGIASVTDKPWYELTPGNSVPQPAVKPKAPLRYNESFVELGNFGRKVYNIFSKKIAFGTDIAKAPGKTYNILGRAYPKDGTIGTKKLYDELIAQGVPESELTGLFQRIPPEWMKLSVHETNARYWNEINKIHIDRIMTNGGDIRFIHDPRLPDNQWNYVVDMLDGDPFKSKCISEGVTRVKAFMKMEYDYLVSKGYILQENGLMIKR